MKARRKRTVRNERKAQQGRNKAAVSGKRPASRQRTQRVQPAPRRRRTRPFAGNPSSRESMLAARLMEISPVGIIVLDARGRIVSANQRALDVFRRPFAEILHLTHDAPEWGITDFEGIPIPGEELPFARVMKSREPVSDVRLAMVVSEGKRAYLSVNASPLLDEAGRSIGMVATVDDVSDRVQGERARVESEHRERSILDGAPFGAHLYELYPDGRLSFVGANPAADLILGVDHSPLIGKTIEEAFPGLAGTPIPGRYRDIAAGGERYEDEHVEYDAAGIKGAFHIHVFQTANNRMAVFFVDITQRKRMEEQNVLLAQALKSVQDCISISDLEDRLIFVNDAFLATYGYTESDVLGKSTSNVQPYRATGAQRAELRRATAVDGWHGEVMNRRKDGTEFPVELWTSMVKDAAGKVIASVGVARDITARKQADEQILASLGEKEILLKEVHHRVKNNMQVISSLLSLAAARAPDARAREQFEDSMTRIRSMAMVHEKLYRSPSLAGIDFGDYLESVTSELIRLFYRDGLSCSVEATKVSLGIDIAIPCGLIVNELVANALKHAFVGRQSGTVVITLRRKDDATVEMAVQDDGVGFPADLDFRSVSSMGMTLVVSLSNQIGGTVELIRSGGTRFVVTFPA